jgi:hypothetical protein
MSRKVNPKRDRDILPEYDFSHAVRGKHRKAYATGNNVIFLEPDLATVSGVESFRAMWAPWPRGKALFPSGAIRPELTREWYIGKRWTARQDLFLEDRFEAAAGYSPRWRPYAQVDSVDWSFTRYALICRPDARTRYTAG